MKVNPKILELISHNVLADERFAFSFFSQINSLETKRELRDFIAENEEKNACFFASPSAEGMLEFADYSSEEDIQPGSIFIMTLSGPVMPYSAYGIPGLDLLEHQIRWAIAHPNISSIVFRLETGGGSVYRLWPFCDLVAEMREKKPIVMLGQGFCASAGIAISVHGTETYGDHESTEFGSIGVCMSYMDMIPWFEKEGCKYHYVNAPTNPEKNKAFTDLRAGKKETMEAELAEMHEVFKTRVRANRTGIADQAMTGRMYTGEKAINEKIIDGIATLEQAVSRAYELANNK